MENLYFVAAHALIEGENIVVRIDEFAGCEPTIFDQNEPNERIGSTILLKSGHTLACGAKPSQILAALQDALHDHAPATMHDLLHAPAKA